jgi:hypothetical protein
MSTTNNNKPTTSPPPFLLIKATTSLFFLAFILSSLITMSSIKLKKQPGSEERIFPRPTPDAWTTTDALVTSDESRDIVPWPLRVHDTWRKSYGSLPLLRSHTKFCRVPQLHVQVDSPFRSETAMGKIKRSYVCLRFDKQCRGQEMEELWDRRYFKKYDTYQATFLMTDTTALNRLKRDDSELFDQVMWQREGEAYVSALDGGDAISGNKQKQLSVKRRYAESFGCDYNSLRIQPAQFSMSVPSECRAFFKFASQHLENMWIMKPTLGSGGVGITLHTGIKDFNDLSKCKKAPKDQPNANKFIIQEYVKFPLLIHEKKFDMRVYMLIASSNPYIIFYHKGYLRRAVYNYDPNSSKRTIFLTNTHFQSLEKNFELADHIWGWARFQKYLADHLVAGAQYVSTVLDSSIKKVMLFNFWSAKEELVRRKGSYHLFGLDFMIDDELRVHFIEANGFPGYTWSKDFPTRTLVTTLIDLIVELHEAPKAFEHMTRGDTYGEFELIYNELEDVCSDLMYNPCVEFANHNTLLMKQTAKRVSELHDSGRRSMYKAKKVKEKDRQKALDACRKQGVDINSKECAQIMYENRRQRFVAYYAEVRAWNVINKFVAGM